ncbi:MAG: PhzF family phenazine biosynthesis protein [Bacteroidota bacterium]
MTIPFYQVDAFTSQVFGGNPAGVCPLDEWLSAEMMQKIAAENNLSETVFFVENNNAFHVRWFTPTVEVDLCGHATLAAAHTLFTHLGYTNSTLKFVSSKYELEVKKIDDLLAMFFPRVEGIPEKVHPELGQVMGNAPKEVHKAEDWMLVYECEEDIKQLSPDLKAMSKWDCRGVIATAPGKNVDFVSRFFAPAIGVDEDPVTGSAHTMLIPYWADRLERSDLMALQLSARGGALWCKNLPEHNLVEIKGSARTYLQGSIHPE